LKIDWQRDREKEERDRQAAITAGEQH